MKASFVTTFAATAAAIPTGQNTSVGNSLDGRATVPLPSSDQALFCNTQDDSAGTANIKVAIAKLQEMHQTCAPGADGQEVRMVAGGKQP